MTCKHHSTTVASQSAKIKLYIWIKNNTLGIIQHINHEASLHKEHYISTSHIFFFEKFGGRASPPFHFIKGTYMSSLLHVVYGILAGGGEENSKAQAWATCLSDGGNLPAQSSTSSTSHIFELHK
jgi:hypothetical protein